MQLPDQQLLIAVLFLVCLLALILVLTVHTSKPAPPPPKGHYAENFDRGSFRDFMLIGLILLPFAIIYVLRHWV